MLLVPGMQHSARELELGHLHLLGPLAHLIKEAVWVSTLNHCAPFLPEVLSPASSPHLLPQFPSWGQAHSSDFIW